jgi:uncharacterized membrane protein YqgA involved in biofilm formation
MFKMNPRFPILSFLSVVLKCFGWLVVAGGLFSSLKQVVALARCLLACSFDIPWLLQNIDLLFTGIIAIVIGESIGAAFSIENNTHKMAEAMENRDSNPKA